ncbi:MAG: FUSC family protein [Bacteroidetes bacterium]|nr:FUSC family protein [Bacteroidota bacterium]
MLKRLNRFFKSLDFLKGIVMAIAMLVPVFFSKYYLNDINIGFSMALGVLFCSPTDVPGSNKHVFFGILIASFLSFSLTLLFGSVANNIWLLIPVLGISVFIISYISVFGFRASLISFVGLLAIVLSFTNDYSEVNLLQHASLIALGGLWYLVLTYLKILVFPKFQTDQLFVKVLEKTSEYLKIRADLLVCTTNRDALNKKLFDLQFEINDLHETLREIILSTRNKSGFSNKIRRQQLLFSELVDILELAISNPVDYEKFDIVFEKAKGSAFQKLIVEMANQLVHISKVIRKEERLKVNDKIPEILKGIATNIDLYRILIGMPKARVDTIMLLNFKNYQEKQAQNIISIERVLNNYTKRDKILSQKEADRFITPQDYDLKKLTQNLSFKSPLFKHSLRLSIIVLIGFLLGNMFSMQNPYWILITIIVIMRPSFGLTKTRSIHRVIGTLIGASIAVAIIFMTQNTFFYGVIAVISLPLAFSFLQLNYRNAAIFITLHVLFIYAIFEPNILSVVQFRIIDTLIGATLAFTATYILFPSWQAQNIHENFSKAMKSNLSFLNEIALFYHEKGTVSTKYKLHRKEAFLAIGDLNAAFQRLNQDPKSKQSELSTIYEMTVFNNTFLSSLTSLGTFIRNNKTSEAPLEFDVYIENIGSNLQKAVNILENKKNKYEISNLSIEDAEDTYEKVFSELSDKRDEEIALGEEHSLITGSQLKEVLLVSEQLKWLNKLSEKLLSSSEKYKSNNKSVL